MLDLIVILILLVFAVRGYLRGALLAGLVLGALIVSVVAGPFFGASLGSVLAAGSSPSLAYLIGSTVAGLLVYASLSVCAHLVNRKWGKTEAGVVHRWNRNLGALTGLLTGLLVALVLLFVADVVAKTSSPDAGGLAGMARRSTARRWISGHNPADRFLVTDVVRLVREARKNPEVARALQEQEAFKEMTDDPAFQRVLHDEDLAAAIHSRNVQGILGNANLRALLEDRELMRRLVSPELRQAIREARREGAARAASPGTKTKSTEAAPAGGPAGSL